MTTNHHVCLGAEGVLTELGTDQTETMIGSSTKIEGLKEVEAEEGEGHDEGGVEAVVGRNRFIMFARNL